MSSPARLTGSLVAPLRGDVDGDGQVDVVRYTLQDDGSGNCPCKIRRSQGTKLNNTAPMDTSQPSTNYSVELDNVVNSLGAGSGGVADPTTGYVAEVVLSP